jgi:hypothetical protein
MMEQRFDQYLGEINADQLKSMARFWGGSGKLRKDESIAIMRLGLADPERVRAVLAKLQPLEAMALGLLKSLGGRMHPGALGVGLHASGVPLPRPSRSNYRSDTTLIEGLIRQGLLLIDHAYDPASTYYLSYGSVMVFSDDRLLAQVGVPEPETLPLNPTGTPESSTYRRPPTVILDIIGILRTIDQMGGLQLTRDGKVRVNEVRRLRRALRWPDRGLEVDGILFASPVEALVGALRCADLLSPSDGVLMLTESVDQIAVRPYTGLVSSLMSGFILNTEWVYDRQGASWDRGYYGNQCSQGRLALTLALTALPVNTPEFFAIDELVEALFQRIGEHFSLGYPPPRPYPYNKTPEQVQKEEASWRAKLHASWLYREGPWIGLALTTWLYYLGLVELGVQDRNPVSVRLTELGRGVLRPELEVIIGNQDVESLPAWVVQPNFEVMAYLDRTTPQQLVFLERHAERVQAQQHTAQYRLTRESVYLSLEDGTVLEDLLSGLEAGNGAQLPPNLVVEIREWAALREQITLRRQAHLLEFPSELARRTALAQGLEGVILEERFILVSARELTRVQPRRKVDYALPLAPCLSIDEDGKVQLIKPPRDLLVRSQLDQWAEGTPDSKWRLTPASVKAAVRGGRRIDELLKLLDHRLARPLPPLIAVALRAWAGERLATQVADVTVLYCAQPAVFQAIVASGKTRPYLRGILAPDVLLVDPEQVTLLKKELAWAGLELSDKVVIEADHRG